MKLTKSWKPIAALVLIVGLGVGCADDKPVEEPIQANEMGDPATPPDSVDDVTQPVYFAFRVKPILQRYL